jgi:hypothetical protein
MEYILHQLYVQDILNSIIVGILVLQVRLLILIALLMDRQQNLEPVVLNQASN